MVKIIIYNSQMPCPQKVTQFSGLFFLLLGPVQMIWTRPKQLVLNQNDLVAPKSFWTHRRTRHTWSADYLHERNISKVKSFSLVFLTPKGHYEINWPLLGRHSVVLIRACNFIVYFIQFREKPNPWRPTLQQL